MTKKINTKLDSDEQALSDSFDKREWKSVNKVKQEKRLAKKVAKNTLGATPVKVKRKPGSMKGKIKMAADFNEPLPDDIFDQFEEK